MSAKASEWRNAKHRAFAWSGKGKSTGAGQALFRQSIAARSPSAIDAALKNLSASMINARVVRPLGPSENTQLSPLVSLI
jgi:hypothetical protein